MYKYRIKTLEEFLTEARLEGAGTNWRDHFEFDGKEIWLGREISREDGESVFQSVNYDGHIWSEDFDVYDDVREEYSNREDYRQWRRGDMDFMVRPNHLVMIPLRSVKSFKGVNIGDAIVDEIMGERVMHQITKIFKEERDEAWFEFIDEDGDVDRFHSGGAKIIKKRLFNKIK